VLYVTDLCYPILNEWYLTLFPSQPKRYTNIKPLLNFIPIKVHRVFLSHNIVGVSSHHLIFHHHTYARELSIRSILHAGRYLDDKEICYLRTVRITAAVDWSLYINVCKYFYFTTPGRCQTLYIVFLFGKVLCFC